MQIAIDGKAGSGKSTVAKIVADKLNYLYVDTGAMYRALTYLFLENDLEINSENGIYLLDNNEISFLNNEISINGISREIEIRNQEIATNVSLVASFVCLRDRFKIIQQKIANNNDVVMDGRDIGTNVLKKAEVKIYLDADVEIRAKRRFKEFLEKNSLITIEEVIKSIKERDDFDDETQISLYGSLYSNETIVIDTTKLNIDEVVEKILQFVKEKR